MDLPDRSSATLLQCCAVYSVLVLSVIITVSVQQIHGYWSLIMSLAKFGQA